MLFIGWYIWLMNNLFFQEELDIVFFIEYNYCI